MSRCTDFAPATFQGHWREWHRGHGCDLDPTHVKVEGDYMLRSIADFQRSCEVHIAEEQRKPSPDTALIALLCDAIRCARELANANRVTSL